MRLTPKMQYALLFCLYLTRAGKVTLLNTEQSLNLGEGELFEVADLLYISKIVSCEGMYFSLVGNPTVSDVLKAISPKPTLTDKERNAYRIGDHEHRALALFADNLSLALLPVLDRTIRGIGNDLILDELNKLDTAVVTER